MASEDTQKTPADPAQASAPVPEGEQAPELGAGPQGAPEASPGSLPEQAPEQASGPSPEQASAAEAAQPEPSPQPANDEDGTHGAPPPVATPPRWLRIFGHSGIAEVLLIVVTLAAFLPGFWTVPPLDRDEPRFAQASKQMLETGNYSDIRFQQEARYKKPVGIYWLQAAAAKATGYGADAPIWVYRLPSIIGAILAVLLTFWTARAFTGPPQAFLAALFVAVAVVVGVEARLAKTDAMLLATIVASQGALARIWLSGKARQPLSLVLTFWIALGLGVLIKGPVAPMIVGLTILALVAITRRVRWLRSLRPLMGLGILVVLVAPWFVSIGIATKGAFFQEALGRDLIGKLGQGQESHGAPPLTHLAAMFGTFWPLPAFLLAAIAPAIRNRRAATVQFCVAWVVPSWIVFELVATKLPHYTMPLLPGLAILTAFGLVATAEAAPRRWLAWIMAVLLALVPLVLAVGSAAGPIYLGVSPSPPGVVLCVLAAIVGLYGARAVLRGAAVNAVPRAVLTTLLLYAGVWGFVMPALSPIWVSPRLAEAADQASGCAKADIFSVGFNEPSFIFLTATDTKLGNPDAAATWIAQPATMMPDCRVVAVESRYEGDFLDKAKAEGVALALSSRVEGVNINGGRKLDIAVYKRTGP
ncbi:glycosyltransferase family 39 protein [Breoghania sp. JC706]|uniref:ArnT family glycosyltransferase n=1 Tax=Breoghania sp. JC706 TaxID=3117732 RepID=UPI00300B473D